MGSLLLNVLLVFLKSDAVQNLALGLVSHLADNASHPLTHDGLTVVKHIIDGSVDVSLPINAETAITTAAAIAVDAIKVHKGE